MPSLFAVPISERRGALSDRLTALSVRIVFPSMEVPFLDHRTSKVRNSTACKHVGYTKRRTHFPRPLAIGIQPALSKRAESRQSDGGSAFDLFWLRSHVRNSGDPLIEFLTFFFPPPSPNPRPHCHAVLNVLFPAELILGILRNNLYRFVVESLTDSGRNAR